MAKPGEFFRAMAKVIKPIVEYYRKDKIKLVRFLVTEGYQKQKIAEVLDVTPGAITIFLKRNEGEK